MSIREFLEGKTNKQEVLALSDGSMMIGLSADQTIGDILTLLDIESVEGVQLHDNGWQASLNKSDVFDAIQDHPAFELEVGLDTAVNFILEDEGINTRQFSIEETTVSLVIKTV